MVLGNQEIIVRNSEMVMGDSEMILGDLEMILGARVLQDTRRQFWVPALARILGEDSGRLEDGPGLHTLAIDFGRRIAADFL